MRERRGRRAEHLRHAAHRVGVLYAVAVHVARMDLAVRQQRAQARGDFSLRRQAAGRMDAVVKRCVAAREAFDGQRPGGDRGAEQHFPAKQPLDGERGAQLGTVQQRQAFLRLEADRCTAGGCQDRRALETLLALQGLALTDQREREVRQRGEIAGGAHRATARNDRQHVGGQQRQQRVHDRRADAGKADREAVGLEQHDAAYQARGQRFADAAGMAAHQVVLQLSQLGRRDAGVGKGAEPGVDAVAGLAGLDHAPHRRDAALHACARDVRQGHVAPPAFPLPQHIQRQCAIAQHERVFRGVTQILSPPMKTASGLRPPSW